MDITKCGDLTCPKRANCKRFMAESDQYWQSYFCESPRQGLVCREYWPMLDYNITYEYVDITNRIMLISDIGIAEIFPIKDGHVAYVRLAECDCCNFDKIAANTKEGVEELIKFCELFLT